MRDKLTRVVEDVRSQYFNDSVERALAEKILDIETKHIEDRPRAREAVGRAIQHYVSGGAEA